MDKASINDSQDRAENPASRVPAFLAVTFLSPIFFSIMAAFLIVVSEILKELFSNTPLRQNKGTFLAYFIAVPLTILGIWLVNKFGFKRLKNFLGKRFYIAEAIGFAITATTVVFLLCWLFRIAAG